MPCVVVVRNLKRKHLDKYKKRENRMYTNNKKVTIYKIVLNGNSYKIESEEMNGSQILTVYVPKQTGLVGWGWRIHCLYLYREIRPPANFFF